MENQEYVYWVNFKTPPTEGDDKTDFFFMSLSAIYEQFTPAQIGCQVTRLWNLKISDGETYVGRLCRISREPLYRKRHIRPVAGDNNRGDDL
jgi:hypothetical protein